MGRVEEKQTEEQLIPKMPGVLYFLISCCYLAPVILYTPFVQFTGILTYGEYAHIVLYPFMIFGYTLNPFMALGFCLAFRKIIRSFKNTPEGIEKFNRRLRVFYTVMISGAIMFAVASALAWTMASASRVGNLSAFGDQSPFFCLLLLNLALVCDGSLLFFVVFMQKLEKLLWKVNFSRKQLSMNLFMRNMCTICFSSLGCFGLVIATLMVPANLAQGFGFVIRVILPITICCFLFIVMLVSLLIVDTNYVVNGVVGITQHLEEKDYCQEDVKATSRSELGLLANSISGMKNTTRGILTKITDATNTTISKFDELVVNMEQTEENVVNINTIIQKMDSDVTEQKSEVEHTDRSVKKIINTIEELNSSVEMQSSAVVESSASVEEMVKNVESVTRILEKNNENVNQLTDASDKGKVRVDSAVNAAEDILKKSGELINASAIIQNIAAQTSLLAMNASIESAHAGEAGKGFAVVADEIRKLADQSTNQVKSIDENLHAVSDAIAQIAEEIRQVQSVFGLIYDSAKKVQSQEEVIFHAMEEQTAGNKQVIEAISSINEAMVSVKQGSGEMLSNGNEIQEILTKFSALSVTMGEDIRKINDISSVISASVNATGRTGNETNVNLQDLLRELKEFKI